MRLALFIVSLLCYVASLLFPAFGCNYLGADSSNYTIAHGYELLTMGWLGLLVFNIAWFANIVYYISVIILCCQLEPRRRPDQRSRPRTVICFSGITILIGLSALFLYADSSQQVGLYAGFYLWMLSFICIFVAALMPRSMVSTGRNQRQRLPA